MNLKTWLSDLQYRFHVWRTTHWWHCPNCGHNVELRDFELSVGCCNEFCNSPWICLAKGKASTREIVDINVRNRINRLHDK